MAAEPAPGPTPVLYRFKSNSYVTQTEQDRTGCAPLPPGAIVTSTGDVGRWTENPLPNGHWEPAFQYAPGYEPEHLRPEVRPCVNCGQWTEDGCDARKEDDWHACMAEARMPDGDEIGPFDPVRADASASEVYCATRTSPVSRRLGSRRQKGGTGTGWC